MNTVLQEVWEEFTRSKSAEARRRLVVHYLDLVRYVAKRFPQRGHGGDNGLEAGDLMQVGVLGLLEAIDRYSPAQGVKFETFAVPRIRGAMLDEMRQLDWVPRSVRATARKAEQAARAVTQEAGREALDGEIASRLSMTLEEYHEFLGASDQRIVPDRALSGDREDGSPIDNLAAEGPTPFERLTDSEAKEILLEAIQALPERDRTVISLYYYEGLKLTEIGRILQVSESRVSQIHADVLRGLRAKLGHLA
jgi:RNA polymerase sigma factor for flagellar operon FliA